MNAKAAIESTNVMKVIDTQYMFEINDRRTWYDISKTVYNLIGVHVNVSGNDSDMCIMGAGYCIDIKRSGIEFSEI